MASILRSELSWMNPDVPSGVTALLSARGHTVEARSDASNIETDAARFAAHAVVDVSMLDFRGDAIVAALAREGSVVLPRPGASRW